MKKIVLSIILSLVFMGIYAQNDCQVSSVKCQLHEVRAVWLTTIGGIDWPHSYSQSPYSARKQQQEFCDILDKLSHAGINTVIIQTRIRATTIFDSKMEPWDGCLSGFPGQSPGYDGLEFCINECHKRGMKLHAWIVTLPVGRWNGAGCRCLRKTCPELLKRIGDEVYMNPEKAGTATYLAAFCKDLVSRYDVDGIHLDYCRYPDGWGPVKDPDKGRENITRIVRAIATEVRALKPWVQMSCSPVGKYADTKRQWAHGWNARDVVCQDAIAWLQEGLMDALYPMMYFRNENFYPFAIDWKERSYVTEPRASKQETFNKIIAPGLGIYFMDRTQKNWPLEDCTREFWVLRQYGMGNCMFRSKFFTDNTKGVYDFYNNCYGVYPSLQTPMTWLSDQRPAAPTNLTVRQDKENCTLSWDSVKACAYNLYGSDDFPVDVTRQDNLLAANLTRNYIDLGLVGNTTYFAVTATDRYGNESAPLQLRPSGLSETSGITGLSVPSGMTVFPYHDGIVNLTPPKVSPLTSDVKEGILVIISSLEGNDLTSAIVHRDGAQKFIQVGRLPVGHYFIHSIKKKKLRHLLGRFEVKP